MSVDAPAFQPQGFLLGQAMANGLPSKKRVVAGIMLAISPTPFGMAATISLVKSARKAQRAANASSPTDPKGGSDGSGGTGSTGTGTAGTGTAGAGSIGGAPTVTDPVTRAELVQDAKEMFDAVTQAAQAVGDAAKRSGDAQAKVLELIAQRDGPVDSMPPPPTPPPASGSSAPASRKVG